MTSNPNEIKDIYDDLGKYIEDWKKMRARAEAPDAHPLYDIQFYKDFCEDNYKHWSKFYLTLTKDHTKKLVSELVKSSKAQLIWAKKRCLEVPVKNSP